MWRCTNCGEKNEQPFKSCWQCETLREGVARQTSAAPAGLREFAASLSYDIARHFACRRCRHIGAEVRALAGPEADLADSDTGFLAIACGRCGCTDFFDAGILKRQGDKAAILTLLLDP